MIGSAIFRRRVRQRIGRVAMHLATMIVVILVWALALPLTAQAAVVIFDGFGDADLDNNGIALEPYDVDVSSAGDGTAGDTYEPVQNAGADTIFANGVMVQEVTAVENASQRGVPWYFTAGFTSGTSPDPKVSPKIINDSAAFMPDTNPAIGFTSNNTPGQVTVEAINTGLALAMESKGRGSSAAAFFDEDYSDGNQGRISLGPEVGDTVRVSFDFRIWMSAPNFNSQGEQHVPTESELRFGLFQDTDEQLGDPAPGAGLGGATVIWGEAGGLLRGGAGGVGGDFDHGWFARVQVEDSDETDPSFKPLPGGADARVAEELNDATDTNRAFMNGSQDSVVVPDQMMPNFVNLSYRKVYHLALSLTRHDDPDNPGTADAVLATLEVKDRATGQVYSISDFDAVGVPGTNDPDGGFESDSWDYFAISSIGNLDEIDWVLDNFMVEVIGSNAPAEDDADFDGDGDVDGADFLTWQRGLGLTNQPNKSTGDANDDQTVNGADLAVWKSQFGGSSATGSAGVVPEPTAARLALAGLVGGGLLGRRRTKRF